MKDLNQAVSQVKFYRGKLESLWCVRDKARKDGEYNDYVATTRIIAETKLMLITAERDLIEACVLMSNGYDLALLPKQAVRQ